jgi:hypothetical protein
MAFASAVRGLLLPICNRPVLRREIHGGGCGSVRAQQRRIGSRNGSCAALSPTNGHCTGCIMKYLAIILVGLSFSLAGCGRDPGPKGDPGSQGPAGPQGAQGIRKVPRATKVKKVTREKKAIRATQAPRSASSKLMAL